MARCSYHRAVRTCATRLHLLTDRERRVVEKTIPKTATILRGRRTTRDMRGNGGASIKNDAFASLFAGVTDATKPPLKPRAPISGMRTRADGLLNDSIAETDPNYKAAKLISDMTSAKQVAAPSEGAAPASFAGTGRSLRPFVHAVAVAVNAGPRAARVAVAPPPRGPTRA